MTLSPFLPAGVPCPAAGRVHSPRHFNHAAETLPDPTHVCHGFLDLLETGKAAARGRRSRCDNVTAFVDEGP